MILSMTGFGGASSHAGDVDYFVELRSVNNKYLKSIMRLPEDLQPLEPELDVALRKRLHRGTVTLRVMQSDRSDEAAFEINQRALDRYVEQIRATKAFGAGDTIDLAALLSLPGVLQPPGDEDERVDRARAALIPLIGEACDALIEMRTREGQELERDLMTRHATIAAALEKIEARSPEVVREYERRLKARMEALIAETGMKLDPAELIREIAVYAERTDIAEEVTRLRGHLAQFEEIVGSEQREPVGRTLEFLTQELLREANTIASKSPDAEVSRLAVEIKGAIDRIKEQVLNVE